MSGKCRPSLRPKTLLNVDLSNLSKTDKECIHAVFELADRQNAEIADERAKGDICASVIKRQDKEIASYRAELERFKKIETTVNALWCL